MSDILGPDAIYYEDLEVGMERTSPARTVTETDIVNFAAMSGDWNRIHTDKEFCAETPFGERIAHGILGLSIASGLVARNANANQHKLVAFLGMDWNFKRPIYIGDTVHVVQSVNDKQTSRKPGLGIITFGVKVKNQKGKVCQEGEWKIMYEMKNTE